MSDTKTLSEKHWEILGIQNAQLRSKAKELRFIAKNAERIIELMYQRAEESRDGYAERDAYNLWRGHSIDTYVMRTNWDPDLSAYHTVEQEVSN
tara:strand:- start:879 stop:1160 length:282 start_codon:yes stop_codon:yes gene_type:complete